MGNIFAPGCESALGAGHLHPLLYLLARPCGKKTSQSNPGLSTYPPVSTKRKRTKKRNATTTISLRLWKLKDKHTRGAG
jgi:hypothetical protein